MCGFVFQILWSKGGDYCWFESDVTTAMLVIKNKSLSLLRELNSIFM